jgi:hypothetical protein
VAANATGAGSPTRNRLNAESSDVVSRNLNHRGDVRVIDASLVCAVEAE